MDTVLQSFIFAFGAIVGSFLNAVIFRLRTRESFVHGRSHCMGCGHVLGWADLVPMLSWLFLRGKCRYCDSSISPQYLMVEATTGLAFLLSALVIIGDGVLASDVLPRLLFSWAAIAVLIVVFVYDLKYMLILRSVTLPAAILAGVANLALGMSLVEVVFGTLMGGGFFWVQRVLSRGAWVGGGDVNLGWFIGALLGWPTIVLGLFLSYIMGAVVGVTLLAGKRAGWRTEIPFGTFLSLGTFIAMLWGSSIITWYLGLL